MEVRANTAANDEVVDGGQLSVGVLFIGACFHCHRAPIYTKKAPRRLVLALRVIEPQCQLALQFLATHQTFGRAVSLLGVAPLI